MLLLLTAFIPALCAGSSPEQNDITIELLTNGFVKTVIEARNSRKRDDDHDDHDDVHSNSLIVHSNSLIDLLDKVHVHLEARKLNQIYRTPMSLTDALAQLQRRIDFYCLTDNLLAQVQQETRNSRQSCVHLVQLLADDALTSLRLEAKKLAYGEPNRTLVPVLDALIWLHRRKTDGCLILDNVDLILVPILDALAQEYLESRKCNSNDPDFTHPMPADMHLSFCPDNKKAEFKKFLESNTMLQLAIKFKFNKSFKDYRAKVGETNLQFEKEIQEIFALHIFNSFRIVFPPKAKDYNFLERPRNWEWYRMMQAYCNTTRLELGYPYSDAFKKPLSPELINFFVEYCGTTELIMPKYEGDSFAGFDKVEIPGISVLFIMYVPDDKFPMNLHNFTGLTALKIRYARHLRYVNPELTTADGKEIVFWPKLKELCFISCAIERINEKFLEKLPQGAELYTSDCPRFLNNGGITISKFLGRYDEEEDEVQEAMDPVIKSEIQEAMDPVTERRIQEMMDPVIKSQIQEIERPIQELFHLSIVSLYNLISFDIRSDVSSDRPLTPELIDFLMGSPVLVSSLVSSLVLNSILSVYTTGEVRPLWF